MMEDEQRGRVRCDAAANPGPGQEGMKVGTRRPRVAGHRAGLGTKPECALKSRDRSFKLPSQIPYRGFREEGD